MRSKEAGAAFFDTNVLLYLTASEDFRQDLARSIAEEGGTVSVQVLNEFVSVSRRKLKLDWSLIGNRLQQVYFVLDRVVPLTEETHRRAFALASRYGYDIYDANILASALLAGCTTLYTEDMQDGQRIESLIIRNPFIAPG